MSDYFVSVYTTTCDVAEQSCNVESNKFSFDSVLTCMGTAYALVMSPLP